MAGSGFGTNFRITTWGETHGAGVGVVVDGCPAGLPLEREDVQKYLDRRKPGQSKYTTQRKEGDQVEILSGIFEGRTTGTPISMVVYNKDQRSKDYSNIKDIYRPGHADFTFDMKYGFRDYRGGEQLDKTRDKFDKVTNGIENLENKSNKTDLSKVKKEMDEVKSSADNLKSAVGGALKEAGAAATAVGGALTGAVISANSEEKALNSLQAQTGLTTEELSKYESIIGEIYKDNFGESQEDIANTLSKIKQVTDEQNPQKLKDMAENLYTLEATFDNFDISETLRGINGLMTNMGLTADEAFDYIVKGAQNGLNYSGELGDNIAEYSQIWGQAGFDAEQMFSILENGTKNGAYNLDKVNDFVKEFTISLSDGRIEENLGSFSKGTGEIFKKWKDGKATASDVFYSVISDLKNTKNEQKALTTASTVWSALGEDNAMKVIKSLGNVNKNYKNVKGSMEKIKDIKYDDVESDWASLGRTVQTDVVNPIGKSLFPEVKKLCKFASKHTDDIIPTLKIVGTVKAIVRDKKY